jgi:hypothetical protein
MSFTGFTDRFILATQGALMAGLARGLLAGPARAGPGKGDYG